MNSLRIQNLRNLEDTGFIDLKPITLLLGQNNSGKSTFLRTLPLLRQSIEMRPRGPILWYGQYVDFGNFSDAVRSSADVKEIGFSFNFSIDIGSERSKYLLTPFTRFAFLNLKNKYQIDNKSETLNIVVALKISWDSSQEVAFTKSYSLNIFDYKYDLSFSYDGNVERFMINDRDLSPLMKNQILVYRESIIPHLVMMADDKNIQKRVDLFEDALVEKINELSINRHEEGQISEIISNWIICDSRDFLNKILLNNNKFGFSTNIESPWTIETEEFKELRDLWLSNQLKPLMSLTEEYIRIFASNCRYIAPLRATAERYYRIQNLSIDEVDYQGRNLPMYISSLSHNERTDLSDWASNLFGFTILTHSQFGHVSVKLGDNATKEEYNLADLGFGYSQLLPILVQLWALVGRSKISSQRRFSLPVVVAIEQPELHLHPRLQAILADAFVKVIKEARKRDIDAKLIIETHSPTIVTRLGHQIMSNKVSPEDINLVIFEKESNSSTQIRLGAFDNDGYLTNWPYGFFEPDGVNEK